MPNFYRPQNQNVIFSVKDQQTTNNIKSNQSLTNLNYKSSSHLSNYINTNLLKLSNNSIISNTILTISNTSNSITVNFTYNNNILYIDNQIIKFNSHSYKFVNDSFNTYYTLSNHSLLLFASYSKSLQPELNIDYHIINNSTKKPVLPNNTTPNYKSNIPFIILAYWPTNDLSNYKTRKNIRQPVSLYFADNTLTNRYVHSQSKIIADGGDLEYVTYSN